MLLDAVAKDTSTHTYTIAVAQELVESDLAWIGLWIGQDVKEDIQSGEMKTLVGQLRYRDAYMCRGPRICM